MAFVNGEPMISGEAVRDGLVDGEFFLEYFPTVSLADGRCVGAEALARWRRPSGVVQPDDFIPLIEGTPLSGMLTYWALETVAKELGDWLSVHRELNIGVNVPPEILGRGGLEYLATKPGVSEIRNQIIIEVTERGIPDNLGLAALEAASRSGVRIALDDVTLSATNLVILSRCTLDLIKTDRSLAAQITPRKPLPGVAQRPLGVAPIDASLDHRRGSRNRGPGPCLANRGSFNGAGVLLFSTHFRRKLQGVLFKDERATGLISDRSAGTPAPAELERRD